MIDKLTLTTFILPDIDYLQRHAEIFEAESRAKLFKFMCRLDRGVISYLPHKFGDSTNAKIPFTRIDLNPKNFDNYHSMEVFISQLLDVETIDCDELIKLDTPDALVLSILCDFKGRDELDILASFSTPKTS